MKQWHNFLVIFLAVLLGGHLNLNAQINEPNDEIPDSIRQMVRQFVVPDTLIFQPRNWFIFPLITYTPETSFAFGAGGLWYVNLSPGKEGTNTSSLQVAGIYTLRKQTITRLKCDLWFRGNDWRLGLDAGYLRFPNRFYGVGNITEDEQEEKYSNSLPYADFHLRRRIKGNWYAGLIYNISRDKFIKIEEGGLIDSLLVPGATGGRNSGLGFSLSFDARDNIYYPIKGGLMLTSVVFYEHQLGTEYPFRELIVDLRKFIGFKKDRVLALQAYSRHQFGDPPFERMAGLGGPELMRGFFQGRYRDKFYSAVQAEFRMPVWKQLGIALFAAAGDVAADFSNYSFSTLKYAGGAGIRVAIQPDEKINMRFDFGYGKDRNFGFYLQFSEAF